MENLKPTCILSGRKENLVMHAHRNHNGQMVGWIFVHEDYSKEISDYDLTLRHIPSIPNVVSPVVPVKLDDNPHA